MNNNINSNPSLSSLYEYDLTILNLLQTMFINNNNLIDRMISSNSEILQSTRRMINNPLISERNQNNVPNTQNNIPNNILNTRTNSILFSLPDNRTSFVVDYIEPTNEIEQILENFLNPVPISISQSQIENAITLVRFSEIHEPRNNSCPISLELFQENEIVTMIKFCGHLFNTNQIHHWFENNVRCPVCRYDIRNYIREIPTENVNINSESTNTLPTQRLERRSLNELPITNEINEVNNRRNIRRTTSSTNNTRRTSEFLNQIFQSEIENNRDISNNFI